MQHISFLLDFFKHRQIQIAQSKRLLFITVTLLLQGSFAFLLGADKARELTAFPCGEKEVVIDGRLNEAIWQKIPVSENFLQQDPDEGQPATERTTIQIAYDKHNIYIAVKAYDSQPSGIIGYLTRRDVESSSDWIKVFLDSYHDRRTAYEFSVNPAGVQFDALWFDDTRDDSNWDAVWAVKTSRDATGWSAEFAIPFTQLRFSSAPKQTWGIQVIRVISRKHETDMWNLITKDAGGFVSLFGSLNGLDNLPNLKGLEILPYVRSALSMPYQENGNPYRSGITFTPALGLDLRYGITSNLSVNVTVNPDFGQVEADPSEFNLTAYETYFEEKRPFFLEGSNIFQWNVGVGDGDMGNESLFYSRRIGGSPHFQPNGDYIKMPNAVRIAGAVKLTGRTQTGWTIGLLEAVTWPEKALVWADSVEHSELVEPWTNFLVGRVRKDMNRGRTAIGGIVTQLMRDIPDSSFEDLHRTATTMGVDITHRWAQDRFQFDLRLAASQLTGSPSALLKDQLSSARYFQRPDAAHLQVDSALTHLEGLSGVSNISKISGNWRGAIGVIFRTPGFDSNEIGYMRNTDFIAGFVWVGYFEFQPGRFLRRYNFNANTWRATNFGNEDLGGGFNFNFGFQLLNYWGFYGGFNHQWERLDPFILRGGPALKIPAGWNSWCGFYSDPRKEVTLRLNINYGQDVEGFGHFNVFPSVSVQVLKRFSFSLNPGLMYQTDDRQYLGESDNSEGTFPLLGRLHQKTALLVTRLNLTLTPELSLQFYGMPFITAGHYDHFKLVTNPRADRYEDRFESISDLGGYDFNFQQFRSNLVLRWEYAAGSTFYLVWSQGRTNFTDQGDFRFLDDIQDLSAAPADHVILLKLNHWFSY